MTARTALRFFFVLVFAFPAIAANAQSSSPVSSSQARQAAGTPKLAPDYGKLPLSFQPNLGQTAKEVQWLARGPEYTLFLAGHDAVLELNKITAGKRGATRPEDMTPSIGSSVVRMNLLGARTSQQTTGEDPQPGKANYFSGNDPAKWQHDVPMYGKVRLQGVYPGIDLVYHGQQGQLEYDFVVAPGADASAIHMNFDGTKVELAANGDLLLPVTSAGTEVRFHKPVVYQIKDGARQPVDGRFVIAKDRQVRFTLGAYDRGRELVIDPELIFLGALGTGNQQTVAAGMALDSDGEIILTGITNDLTFPVTAGALQTSCTNSSAPFAASYHRCGASSASSGFVTKISADGTSLVYSTYLHGLSGQEWGQAVATDASGDAYVLGATESNDFPITANAYLSTCLPYYPGAVPPIAPSCDGYFDGGGTEFVYGGPAMFIAELNPSGSALIYSTFFSGTSAVYPAALALDSSNNMYFTGFVQDAYSAPNIYPTNSSQNIQFPVTSSAYQSVGVDVQAATLSELSADGQTLLYSTLLGALSSPNYGYTQPLALALGPNGMAYVGGDTTSYYLPTTSGVVTPTCLQNPTSGYESACYGTTGFLSAFDTTQSGSASLLYSTFIGGTVPGPTNTLVYGLAADSSNNAYVTGYTNTNNYPVTTGAFQSTCKENGNEPVGQGTCEVGFFSKINPAGSAYVWSTYFGATDLSQSQGDAIAFDAKGRVYLYGYDTNYSYDLPLVNPIEPRPSGSYAFVATFSADGTKLLFSTPIGNQSAPAVNIYPVTNNGIALDATGNIYFGAYGADSGAMVITPGTYATADTSGFQRSFFGKISPVLDPTATTLTISPSTTITGQTVTFTATVAGTTQATPAPTGTVTLADTSTNPATTLGSITLGANGSGTFTTSSLAVGSYSVTATYSADSTYDVSTSSAQTLTINTPASATVSLSVPATATVGTSVTFTATVSGSGGTPTGTVIFMDGATTLGSVMLTNGSASYSTSSLVIGSHSITADYGGDGVFGAASSSAQKLTINGYTAAVALAASPATTHPGQTVTLTATVTASTGTATPTGSVTFLDGTTSIGSMNLASGKATLTTTKLALGSHSITASYSGDSNFAAATSTAQTVVVEALATPTVMATPSQTSITTAQSLTVTVAVSGASGNPTPTGTVTLSGGGYTSSAATLSSGSATITIPANSLSVGTDVLTVSYSGDSNYSSGTGTASVKVSAVPLTPTVKVTPAAATLDSGASLNVTAAVTGSGATPTGTVTLTGGGYTSAAETLSGGSYTFAIPANSLSAGTDTLTVSYNGDSNYASGTGTVSVTVTQSVFTLLATSPAAVAPGSPATSTVTASTTTDYAGTVTLACALTSSPSGATDLPTCSGGSSTVSLSSGTTSGTATVTVSSTSATSELVWPKAGGKGRGWAGAGGGAVLAFLVFLGIPARRRSWRSMLGALVLMVTLGSLSGCGGKKSPPSGTTAGSYTFTVTGAGSPSVSPAPTTTFTLTVN